MKINKLQNDQAMITKSKVTEIFCIIDETTQAGVSRRCFLQSFRGSHAKSVLQDDDVHETQCLRQMLGHFVCRHHDPCVPQRQTLLQRSLQWVGQEREGCHGMVSRLQAALAVQRLGGGYNLLSHGSKRRRQGWPGVESVRQGALWKGVCRQRIYQAGTLRPGNPSRTWAQGQHEEQAYAHVGQDHAQKKIHHRVYQ